MILSNVRKTKILSFQKQWLVYYFIYILGANKDGKNRVFKKEKPENYASFVQTIY